MGPITYTFEELVAHKNGGKAPAAAIKRLRCDADAILEKPTAKVTDIKLPRPSGDPHDFVSIAPYRWPNPDTPDGLPWIPRDGYVNPDTRSEAHPGNVYTRVHTLALAAFYFPERAGEYADYANRQLYDWFMNPETRINPNARYAQALPGICDGRSSGLIVFATCYNLFNAIGILDSLGLMDGEILEGVRDWFVRFGDWILTDEFGLRVDMGHDNHASWHDANVMATAFFTDRVSLKRNIALTAYDSRVKKFIAEDGSQPIELQRTKGMSYSFYNLFALEIVANLSEKLGFTKYWSVDEERGVCILKSAVDFLYPYVKDPDSFPYSELHKDKCGSRMAKNLLIVAKRFPGEGYEEKAAEFMPEDEEWLLEPLL